MKKNEVSAYKIKECFTNKKEIAEEIIYNNFEAIYEILKDTIINWNNKNKSIYIFNKELITDEILELISKSNIENLYLGRVDEDYSLTKEQIEIIKKKSNNIKIIIDIDNDEYVNMFYEQANSYFSDIYVQDLRSDDKSPIIKGSDFIKQFNVKYEITEEMSDEEIIDLLYKTKNDSISFSVFLESNRLYKILSENKELVKEPSNFTIYTENARDVEIDLNTFLKYEKKLNDMVEPALGLSPLEKTIFAINIVKKYKKYLDGDREKLDGQISRKLYEILNEDNPYIVCSGYSALLIDLLKKLGIDAQEYITVYSNEEENPNKLALDGYHSMVIINIIDDIYNVNGYYCCDPYQGSMEFDLFSQALMSAKEVNKNINKQGLQINRYGSIDKNPTYMEESYKIYTGSILFSTSPENFYEIYNLIMRRSFNNIYTHKVNLYYNSLSKEAQKYLIDHDLFLKERNYILLNGNVHDKEQFNCIVNEMLRFKKWKKQKYDSIYYEVKNAILLKLLRELKKVDKEKYNEIYNKYGKEKLINSLYKNNLYQVDNNTYEEIIDILSNYIPRKNNNPISATTMMKAYINIQKKAYYNNYKEAKNNIEKAIAETKAANSLLFPTVSKIIPTKKLSEKLEEVFESIKKLDYKKYQELYNYYQKIKSNSNLLDLLNDYLYFLCTNPQEEEVYKKFTKIYFEEKYRVIANQTNKFDIPLTIFDTEEELKEYYNSIQVNKIK